VLNVAELDAMQVSFDPPDRVPKQPARRRARHLGEVSGGDLHRSRGDD
jgi:hypothetical protein